MKSIYFRSIFDCRELFKRCVTNELVTISSEPLSNTRSSASYKKIPENICNFSSNNDSLKNTDSNIV